ncbi:hypothetical protein ASE86_11495 [Sphingomonas sp. Leaf33]|uniref:hypothetical protein n=1 Tax=Sphingomonas sp. Leaf33 TaxID=1736215 RepID=UPI0006F6976A|nr:hypothetical protein [Sphingomonas sp. Leaf33]KQN26681.1 hypothetical protein ASE86_11495 [Sphingomonas sp. Leaf33]
MTDDLAALVAASLDRPMVDRVRAFAAELARSADAVAVLFYGSNLRTGSLEGVLDFYVLTDGPRERGLWPRVGYREWNGLRAKIATMTLATFAAAAADRTIDTTIWTRFVQPAALAWATDDARPRVERAIAAAAVTAGRYAAALGPATAPAGGYWRALFRATYAAELRVEAKGREEQIMSVHGAHLTALLPAAWAAGGLRFDAGADGTLAVRLGDGDRAAILRRWRRRQRLGRPLNIVRLVRAAFTFDGAARYAAWKIERHTGVVVPITPFRERHPVLAAPGVLWRVWRARS